MYWKSFILVQVIAFGLAIFGIGATAAEEDAFESAEMIEPGTYQGRFSESNLADGYIVHGIAGQELQIMAEFDLVSGTLNDPRNPVVGGQPGHELLPGFAAGFGDMDFPVVASRIDQSCPEWRFGDSENGVIRDIPHLGGCVIGQVGADALPDIPPVG